ncbi:MAG: GH3 auxin-responsive promoter family protein [Bacteroidales bacterium]|nr:GH3 auxin-responsive promoter family protein [Bacteroidales bacterium]
MDFLTSLARRYFSYRILAMKRYDTHFEQIQREVLAFLVQRAANTLWGREHGYESIKDYADFAARVPVGNYASHKPYIVRMMEGEPDILWKGRVKYFATSSGTTSDNIKFIPVSHRGLHKCHMQGGHDVTASYLHAHPESEVAKGYSLILSGNFNPKYTTEKAKVGDVSAIMAASIPQFFRRVLHIVPDLEQAQITDINRKYDAIAGVIADKRLVSVSGTPDWLLVLLRRTAEKAGAKSFGELWPRMEFFAHGGMSMMPYRPIYEAQFAPHKITFIENYNASEGFFGVQTDTSEAAMLLMLDYDVFYEFIPMSEYGRPGARAIPLWEAETGVDYALLVSTSSGLWRYDIGDVVRFTRKAPYKFVIVGRTHQCINVWGEDLSVQQAEKALSDACAATGATVIEFAVAPLVYADSAAGHHQWLIEFEKRPADMARFAAVLEKAVRAEDHDYEHFSVDAGGILQPLEVIEARPGLFYEWMDARGKFGGQHKVPRLSAKRNQFEELLALNK